METTNELVFSVKACVGVHLKVGHDKDEPKNNYLVDIGTDFNAKSMIRSVSDLHPEFEPASIMFCQ